MKLAIVEDEKGWQIRIRSYIEEYLQDTAEELDLYADGEQFLAARRIYDAVFMDVEMPGKNGFETAMAYAALAPECRVIILTTHVEMFPEGFRISALRFIDKECMEEDLPEALDELKLIFEEGSPVLVHVVGEGESFRQERNILYAETASHGCLLHEKNGDLHLSESLGTLEKQLNPDRFFRCHHAFLVNWEAVEKLQNDHLLLRNQTAIPLAQKRASEARIRYGTWKFRRASG